MHEKSFSAPSALAGERYPTACRALAPTESQRSYWSRARARVTTTVLNRGAKKGGKRFRTCPPLVIYSPLVVCIILNMRPDAKQSAHSCANQRLGESIGPGKKESPQG